MNLFALLAQAAHSAPHFSKNWRVPEIFIFTATQLKAKPWHELNEIIQRLPANFCLIVGKFRNTKDSRNLSDRRRNLSFILNTFLYFVRPALNKNDEPKAPY